MFMAVMIVKMYLICGLVFEIIVLKTYIEQKDSYSMADLLIGGIIDIIAWPIVLFKFWI